MKMPLPATTKRVIAVSQRQSAAEEKLRVKRERGKSSRALVIGVGVSIVAAMLVVGLIAFVARPGPIAVPRVSPQTKGAVAKGASSANDNGDTPDIELLDDEGKGSTQTGATRQKRRAPNAPVDRPDFLRKSE
jgi:hypothetical protein